MFNSDISKFPHLNYHKAETGEKLHHYRWEFEYFDDFLTIMNTNPVHEDRRCSSKNTGSEAYSFTHTRTYEEAMNLAKNGWPEGRQKISSKVKDLMWHKKMALAPKYTYDVAGMVPDIVRAIAGDPACMINRGNLKVASKPIVKFLLNVTATWNITDDQIMNRGVALLSYIDQLELQGYSIEVSMMCHMTSGGYAITCSFPIKRAGEFVDQDRLAYVIAHPSLLRRQLFRAVELVPDEDFWDNFKYGYGSVYEPDRELLDKFYPDTHYLRSIHLEGRAFHTLESALESVGKYVEKHVLSPTADEDEIWQYA